MESTGPRLTSQDIQDYSRQASADIMNVGRYAKLNFFQDAFPAHTDYVVSPDEHWRRRMEMMWPEQTDETIRTTGVWPAMQTGTSADASQNEPRPSPIDQLHERQKRLRQRTNG